MITVTRTMNTTLDQVVGAVSYLQECAAYIKSKTGVENRIEMPVGGVAYRIRMVAQYESLAAYERVVAQLMSDPKYFELGAKASQFLTPGSAFDEFWAAV